CRRLDGAVSGLQPTRCHRDHPRQPLVVIFLDTVHDPGRRPAHDALRPRPSHHGTQAVSPGYPPRCGGRDEPLSQLDPSLGRTVIPPPPRTELRNYAQLRLAASRASSFRTAVLSKICGGLWIEPTMETSINVAASQAETFTAFPN